MKNRGFVTIATGDDEYYRLAASLCKSYKKWGKGQYPFAIICDRKNEYTEIFDDVVLITEYSRSTIDKFLVRYSPYEENIFLDSDMFVLRSIDDLWDIMGHGDDIVIFGCTYPVDSERGWFSYNGCGKYQPRVKYMVDMNGGIIFYRKTDRAESIISDALKIVDEYAEIDFKRFETPADEPVMSLAMVINDCHPLDYSYEQIIIPGMKEKVSCDYRGHIYMGKKRSTAKLIHFSNIRTHHFLYNYLNDILLNGSKEKTKKNYRKFRLKYLKIDGIFDFKHWVGGILRSLGFSELVERLKKRLNN